MPRLEETKHVKHKDIGASVTARFFCSLKYISSAFRFCARGPFFAVGLSLQNGSCETHTGIDACFTFLI
jgi:hypothetical protein